MPNTIRIPDNLDLADRARLGLNGLMGTCDPDVYYEPYFLTYYMARPAYFLHWSTMQSGVQPKYLEAMALLKCITGSPDTEHEKGFIKAMLDNAEEDGLIYDRKCEKRPWNVGVGYGKKSRNEDYANVAGNGRWINGCWYMHQLTGDDIWKDAMRRCAEKILEITVVKNDYAYIPDSKVGNDFSWIKSGWPNTDEPQGPNEGCEGATTFYQAQTVRGLIKWYKASGDERFLDLSRRLVKFTMDQRFYGGVIEVEPKYGAERAHFWGHMHGNMAAFRGILDYATTAGDIKALEFARDGFEWLRHNICPQLGQGVYWEGCCVGDLPALAVQLSDSGIGDYWDDADYAIRNATAPCQVTDLESLKKMGELFDERPLNARYGAPGDFRFTRNINITDPIPGLECNENVLERSIGAMTNNLINAHHQSPNQMACCTANGLQGFYYGWEAAIRHSGGTCTVNLLYTRFSEWMDLISFAPYEGKAVIKNKTAKTINIRVPGGIPMRLAKVSVNGNEITPTVCGRYVSIGGLKSGEEIVFSYPLEKRRQRMSIPLMGRMHWGYPKADAVFAGTTCIGLGDEDESIFGSENLEIPLYNEPKYRSGETHYKDAPYYVPKKIITWY